MRPSEITFKGPEGSTVVIDEDGPRLVIGGRSVMDLGGLQALVKVIAAAEDAWTSGSAQMPVPPTREEARALYGSSREAAIAKRAQRAIAKEFDMDGAPF